MQSSALPTGFWFNTRTTFFSVSRPASTASSHRRKYHWRFSSVRSCSSVHVACSPTSAHQDSPGVTIRWASSRLSATKPTAVWMCPIRSGSWPCSSATMR